MKAKKLFAMILGISMTAGLLSGCGNSSTSRPEVPEETLQESATDSEPSPEETSSSPETKTLTLAATLGNSTSIIQTTTTMSEKVKEETGGAIDIQVFPDSTLGGQRDFLEGVSMGTVDMCIIAAGALEDFYAPYALYSVPFLFRDAEHTYEFFKGETSQSINDKFLELTGMRIIGLYNEGFRQVWTKDTPIHALSDFSGLKLRVPEVTLYINMFSALGCNATVLPVGDLYTGLQTGLVDGMELPIGSVYGASTYEQTKYCTMTNHIGGAMFLLVNENVWQSLSEGERDCILKYVEEASAQDRQNLENETDNYKTEIEATGVEFIELADEARVELVDAMSSVVSELYGEILDEAMLDEIRSMK